MLQAYGPVRLEKRNRIAIVRIDRKEKLNAMNKEAKRGLHMALEKADEDDSIRVVILAGTDKAFSAGSDINYLKEMSPVEVVRAHRPSYSEYVLDFEKPIIAMIEGYCLGGGLEMALACDIRYASEDAKLGAPEIKLGHPPAGGSMTQTLPRIVGKGWAMWLCLTGDMISALEAKRIGLVDKVYPKQELEVRTMELAENLAEKDLEILKLTKKLIRAADETPLSSGREFEKYAIGLAFTTEAHFKGIKAFFEKKEPVF